MSIRLLPKSPILLLLFAFLFVAIAPAKADPMPNIIYIMCDDLGPGDLGCYGQEIIQTPNIDRMAEEGLRFTEHYAGHTVCRPSRLVLWTGKHVGHTALIGNRDRSLTGKEDTVPKLLKAAGYATGGVGKWALGNVDDPSEIENPGHPNNNGLDYWFGYMNQGNAHNFYPPYLWENKTQFPLEGNVLMDDPAARGRVSEKRVTYSHDVMTEKAFDFVRRNSDKPFLLHIHWTIPHANNEGGRVLEDGMEVPDYGIYADKNWPNPEKGFAAMITRMDGDVGRLFALLKELKIDENTIVFFTSDNGPHEEGQHKHEFFDSNGVLKGYKRSMHEGGVRVPMIARWPGKVAPGTVTDHPSAFWDYMPTACEIAGIDAPEDTDGISYLPTLLAKPDNQKSHEYLYWASSEGETAVGVRDGKWKLVKYRKSKKGDDPEDWRLYNLETDIGEENDVAPQNPEVVERILNRVRRDQLEGLNQVEAPRRQAKTVKVALVGDSTVTDSAGWGKAFAEHFDRKVEVRNFAKGGRSAKSFLGENLWPPVLEYKPDYVLIQFGHNGQPGKGPERETDPETTYQDYLKTYIKEARSIGAKPILVSSVTRRAFGDDGHILTGTQATQDPSGKMVLPLEAWAKAAEAVASEMKVPFIDLYSASVAYHNQIGPEASAAFSPKENDITHFNEAGARAIAGLVLDGLKDAAPKLAAHVH